MRSPGSRPSVRSPRCFPEHGDRVHGLPAVDQGGHALPQRGVQSQREVVGLQPAHVLQLCRVRGGSGEEDSFLVEGFLAAVPRGVVRHQGVRQGAGVRGELCGERVQELSERVGLGQGAGGRVGQGGVGGGLGEAFGVREQCAASVIGSDHSRVRRRVPGPGADLDEGVEVRCETVQGVSETPTRTLQYRADGPEGAPVLVLGAALGTTWHRLSEASSGVHVV